jgi:hypothetical protein
MLRTREASTLISARMHVCIPGEDGYTRVTEPASPSTVMIRPLTIR